MASSFRTNVPAIQAQRRLNESSLRLASTFEQLSSGLRINRAADDAAGLAIAVKLNGDVRILSQGIRNVNDGISYLNVAEQALQQLSTITSRQRELALQASNGVYSTTQRHALHLEAESLTREFNRIVESTSFNSRRVFEVGTGTIALQAGIGNDAVLAVGTDALERGGGSGAFSNGATPPVSRGEEVALADMNGDGILDLISSNSSGQSVSVAFGIGDGTFQAETTFSTGVYSPTVAVGDLNNDGKPDVVLGGTNRMLVFMNTGNGMLAPAVTHTINGSDTATDILVADFNGDGWNDVVLSGLGGGGGIYTYINQGGGTFTGSPNYSVSNDMSVGRGIEMGDFNGDGRIDVAVLNESSPFIRVRYNNGAGSFSTSASFAVPGIGPVSWSNVSGFGVGDLDRDGYDDIVYSRGSDGLHVRFGDASGSFAASISISLAHTTSVASVIIADFSGDGFLDILASNNNLILGQGTRTFTASNTPIGISLESRFFGTHAIGDLNGDGTLDLAVGNSGTPYVVLQNYEGTLAAAVLDLTTLSSAQSALAVIDATASRIASAFADLGGQRSRLSSAVTGLSGSVEHLSAAASRITDLDIAEATARLVRDQILQQTSVAVLAQANAAPRVLLELLSST